MYVQIKVVTKFTNMLTSILYTTMCLGTTNIFKENIVGKFRKTARTFSGGILGEIFCYISKDN